ncbi:PTS fructose transporter subunit IIB [Erysipelothrix sp. HDW6C]|uniref:PTS fructose transporter subunit IIB n=1 Tax=Erysipelothrix sp. HDW6C TaxID=2714930 RepID=UPI001409AFB9|nr:fructose PTS transporter subunit IIB [Erysipelothrix sp. HDW6C]QIK69270.1 PTS fructose transporter subunit IIB [Erysipelothrix sp. HDW6C]
MYIIGITACTAGIAHTYIAKEKLEVAARALGHEVKIETQGTIGAENILTEEDVARASVVIIAADIGISGKDRFKSVPVVEVPISIVMKSPKSLITKIEASLKEKEN